MATPHVSGAIALLWSAIPSLKNQITASRTAMNNAAHFVSSMQCGDDGPPNNVYGCGRMDILAAVDGPTPSPNQLRLGRLHQPHAKLGSRAPLCPITPGECLLSATACSSMLAAALIFLATLSTAICCGMTH